MKHQGVPVSPATRLEHFAGKIGSWMPLVAAYGRSSLYRNCSMPPPAAIAEAATTGASLAGDCDRPVAPTVAPGDANQGEMAQPQGKLRNLEQAILSESAQAPFVYPQSTRLGPCPSVALFAPSVTTKPTPPPVFRPQPDAAGFCVSRRYRTAVWSRRCSPVTFRKLGRESKHPKPPYNSPILFDIGPLPYVQLSNRYQSLLSRCDLKEPIAGGKNVHDPGRKDGAQPR
jgi:hypothetical protein